ncbi:hypothetical protein [Actinocrispum sp. NPDC049592]|uniref:hypothetical protein n=1 Tax=Actinocrispum sp. NPDC049592 TaxID=3154835 RepID=UPI00342922B1
MNEQASIYWRRRMVAISGVVIALVIVGWAAGGFFTDGSPSVQGASGGIRETQPPSSPSTMPAAGPGGSSSSSSTSPPPSPSPSAPPPPPPPPPPDPNQPCPDQAIQVGVELGAPQYKVGQRPVLRLIVVNAGQVPCTRDLSRQLREILVMSQDGQTRLWSSNDCYHYNEPGAQIVQAGERLGYEIKWAGRTSAPGCPSKRSVVPAGTYSVVGKLGALSSQPVPIVLT